MAIKNIIPIIHDAISEYSSNTTEQTPSEWLQSYLGEKLPSKAVDAIHTISGEILDTLDLMEQKKAAVNAAVENGQSAESWLADEIMTDSMSNGEKARTAAAFFNGIVSAQKGLDETVEAEVIDISNEEDWQDDDWNDYKLKDNLKSLALNVGMTSMKEIASDVFVKASEEGIGEVLHDRDFIADTLVGGACAGLKVAVSAGLKVAEESGFLPPTATSTLATTAFRAVEGARAMAEVVKGNMSLTEALVDMKNTAVAAVSGMWQQHKGKILTAATDIAGKVFGPVGAVVGGAVSGLFAKNEEGSRLKTVLKEAGKAALRFLTQEIKLPFLSKAKVLQVNA